MNPALDLLDYTKLLCILYKIKFYICISRISLLPVYVVIIHISIYKPITLACPYYIRFSIKQYRSEDKVQSSGNVLHSLPQTGMLLLSSLATIEHIVMVTGIASK